MFKALAPQIAPPSAAPASPRAPLAIFVVFLLVGSLFFFLLGVLPFYQGMAARAWTETPCRIIVSKLECSPVKNRMTYRPEIRYAYRVGGFRYECDRYQFLSMSSSGREDKAAVVARYPRGKSAVCYVNPKNPADAVLDRSLVPIGYPLLIPLAVIAIGAGGIIWHRRRKKGAAAVAAAINAGEPWGIRPDWAAGTVVSAERRQLKEAWISAGLCNAFAIPVTTVFLGSHPFRNGINGAVAVLFVPLLGLAMFFRAVMATLRWARFGESVMELMPLPSVPGGAVAGTVRLTRPVRFQGPVRLRLNCLARETRNTSDGKSSTERLVWQREETAEVAPSGDTFPVAIMLPPDAAVTTSWNGGDGFFWRLEADAKLPGVNYRARFDIPVCAGELSPEAATVANAVRAREQARAATYIPPASSRVHITHPLRGGTAFYFPPGRSPVGTLIVGPLLAAACWGIRATFANHAYLPMAGLCFVAFILGVILAYIWTSSVRVHVEGGMVTVTQKFLGIPTTRVVAAADVVEIKPDITTNTGASLTYGLKMDCRDGNTLTAGDRIHSEQEAQWLAARMLEAIRKP